MLEPVGRNTAPAVAVAALLALDSARACAQDARSGAARAAGRSRHPRRRGVPAPRCIAACRGRGGKARHLRSRARLGPRPATATSSAAPGTGPGVRRSQQFVEKPDAATRASSSLQSGEYYWNSGMFMFRARRLSRGAASVIAPAMLRPASDAVAAAAARSRLHAPRPEAIREPAERFDRLRGDGEDARRRWSCRSMPAGATSAPGRRCSDALPRTRRQRRRAATCSPRTRATAICTRRAGWSARSASRITSSSKPRTRCWWRPRPRAGREALVDSSRRRAATRRPAPRGVPALGQLRQSRQRRALPGEAAIVKPGASMSLQLHHHRAEHWVVVSGTARITRGDEMFLLGENQSTYIPVGTKHRIENPGMIPLHIIEVQSGAISARTTSCASRIATVATIPAGDVMSTHAGPGRRVRRGADGPRRPGPRQRDHPHWWPTGQFRAGRAADGGRLLVR